MAYDRELAVPDNVKSGLEIVLIGHAGSGDHIQIVFHPFYLRGCQRRSRRTLKSGHDKRQTTPTQ